MALDEPGLVVVRDEVRHAAIPVEQQPRVGWRSRSIVFAGSSLTPPAADAAGPGGWRASAFSAAAGENCAPGGLRAVDLLRTRRRGITPASVRAAITRRTALGVGSCGRGHYHAPRPRVVDCLGPPARSLPSDASRRRPISARPTAASRARAAPRRRLATRPRSATPAPRSGRQRTSFSRLARQPVERAAPQRSGNHRLLERERRRRGLLLALDVAAVLGAALERRRQPLGQRIVTPSAAAPRPILPDARPGPTPHRALGRRLRSAGAVRLDAHPRALETLHLRRDRRVLLAHRAHVRSSSSPIAAPISARRSSALSARSSNRCSAAEVNMRYGSTCSRVTRSSASTPMYACGRAAARTRLRRAGRARH